MVEKASALTGLPVELKRFDEVKHYDGIWTCASLLHVPRVELPAAMNALARALMPNGIWYISFKHGQTERLKDGRQFTDLDERGLKTLIEEVGGLTIKEIWATRDVRPDRDESWLNAILTASKVRRN